MKVRLIKLGEQLQTSLWAIPALSTVLAALLAFFLIEFDRRIGTSGVALTWIFHGGAESARVVLSTIAGSMITVAGTVYSITIVILTLASMQFAPRVLRSFMRDRGNQIVLGSFVATFTYCLIVLRSVGPNENLEFVPATAVAGGVVLGLVSLAMLIYFIDHVAHGIQVSSIIARVAGETLAQVNALYPQKWQAEDTNPDYHPHEVPPADDWAPVACTRSGYLQYIDYDALLAVATRADVMIREERAVGAFILPNTPLAFVSPSGKATPELRAEINAAFVMGTHPTLQQDIAYGIRQIVDIALKAISPAVNDPTTALNCIDHLGVILINLAERKIPKRDRRDAEGRLRIIARERTFHDLVRLAFDQIRHYGAKDPLVVVRLLLIIAQVAAATRNPAYHEVLESHVERIAAAAEREIVDPYELRAVREHVEETRRAMGIPLGGRA